MCPNTFICFFNHCFKLSINFISLLQMATYMKSLARRASFVWGSTKSVKAYKAKVASLTFEKADLQAQDVVKSESDLKHTSTTRARAKVKEKKARGELRVAEGELQAVRDEFHVARDELQVVWDERHIKDTTLNRVSQDASEVVSYVERLTEDCHGLHGDLQWQEALVRQKDGVISELRDEACILWVSG